MEPTAVLDAIRTWLDELAEVEDQFAWLRDVTLDQRPGSAPPEVLLRGEANDVDAEELAKRVDSEPTLGGHFDHAAFTRVDDPGTVGILAAQPM